MLTQLMLCHFPAKYQLADAQPFSSQIPISWCSAVFQPNTNPIPNIQNESGQSKIFSFGKALNDSPDKKIFKSPNWEHLQTTEYIYLCSVVLKLL